MIRPPYRLRYSLAKYLYPWPHLRRNVFQIRDLASLKRALNWQLDPLLDYEFVNEYQHLGDLNDRRRKDAEVIGGACRNAGDDIVLEIGTAYGQMTALMAQNAANATIYTVNIPPEEIARGGKLTTFGPERADIGRYYRQAGISNIHQIYANTANWTPDFGPIDVAFIDGSHDADFVYNDTRKILDNCQSGSIVLWHDFSPPLAFAHHWIAEVCRGVDRLYADHHIGGPIYHLQDSWVGLYVVPDKR